ncbi:APC family permease [archaeon]|nr:MAG: APC family permease [archaeon]
MSERHKGRLSLMGAVSLGTGIMIGAAIFALLGQVAELSGTFFPIVLLIGGVFSSISAYSYIKVANAYPSEGGIAMILKKAYGKGTVTAWAALLMAFAMVINQSLVARTFGTYVMQLFGEGTNDMLVPLLGVGLLVAVFLINISGTEFVESTAALMAFLKIGGIAIFAFAALWTAGCDISGVVPHGIPTDYSYTGFVGGIAISLLAYAGFTSITNSGGELVNPHKNVGRAIVISILICIILYMIVAMAVATNLTVPEIIAAKDYALAEAARPVFGTYGLFFTVGIAILATVSGVLANVFAVSRMTAMLTNMRLIPHSHFGMPGRVQQHMLVYTVVIAIALTLFFDLTRIAAMGAIFYITMDIVVHWGVMHRLRDDVGATPYIVSAALIIDMVVLGAFIFVKASDDIFVVLLTLAAMMFILGGEHFFLKGKDLSDT